MTAALVGLLGVLVLLRALVGMAGVAAGFWATVLAVGGSFLLGPLVLHPSLAAAGGFLLASLTLLALVRWREVAAARLALGLALPALVVWSPVLGVASFGRGQLLEFLWSPQGGLLYRSPVLWGGVCGLVALARRDRRLGAGLLVAAIAMVALGAFQEGAGSGTAESDARTAVLMPPLTVGLAVTLRGLQGLVRRQPGRLLLLAAVMLSLANLLFMEQYRRGLIPRDDTVSFPQVAENGAGLLAQAVGSPLGWPANWLFARRYGLPVDRYDGMAGRRLFRQGRAFAAVDVGNRDSEEGALAEGWSVRHPCGAEVCRQVEGRARLFVGLEEPAPLTLRLRAWGQGSVGVAVNGWPAGSVMLQESPSERGLPVPAWAWRRGLNQIVLSAAPEAEALVDRIAFERSLP